MILFWIKEAFRIFGRAKSSFILSLITLSISILLVTLSLYSVFLSHQAENKIKEKFIINIFLNDSLSINSVEELIMVLKSKRFFSSLTYIDKNSAAETFIKDTGEDFRKILDYNPIPASISLKLKSEFVNTDSIKAIEKELNSYVVIDEIVFEHIILERVVSIIKKVQKYIFIITLILVLFSVYITYSTTRLIISLKNDELETMKLVGAKLSTVKMPIIINEFLIGIFAGIISFICIRICLYLVMTYSTLLNGFYPQSYIWLFVIFIGPAISVPISVLVLRKITLKI
jgi:cell division transport system permease protein